MQEELFSKEQRGDYVQLTEEAVEEYQEALKLNPEDAEACYMLGLAYLAEGQKNRAMAIYPKLKTLDAGSAEMLKRLTEGR